MMKNKKTKRGKVHVSNEAAEVFSHSLHFNKAFSHTKRDEPHTPDSESEAMLNFYSDEEKDPD
ncbi:hypothetical protein MUN89_00135 [Halobacillus salinarum]|uniref:Uncharacterized protein n=1 Tax=Halobacillus salinarum TaxID=2932257 RepID=A0ABY4EK34_9BACI|nr:hypothetical protein [Halobacillus salinarum]UOQ44443.1 hypothetical protein MUN89_00135 [Halobacillus salinarum]